MHESAAIAKSDAVTGVAVLVDLQHVSALECGMETIGGVLEGEKTRLCVGRQEQVVG